MDIQAIEWNHRGDLELIVKMGDRYQAVTINKLDSKKSVVRSLMLLAENIERDELMTNAPESDTATLFKAMATNTK